MSVIPVRVSRVDQARIALALALLRLAAEVRLPRPTRRRHPNRPGRWPLGERVFVVMALVLTAPVGGFVAYAIRTAIVRQADLGRADTVAAVSLIGLSLAAAVALAVTYLRAARPCPATTPARSLEPTP